MRKVVRSFSHKRFELAIATTAQQHTLLARVLWYSTLLLPCQALQRVSAQTQHILLLPTLPDDTQQQRMSHAAACNVRSMSNPCGASSNLLLHTVHGHRAFSVHACTAAGAAGTAAAGPNKFCCESAKACHMARFTVLLGLVCCLVCWWLYCRWYNGTKQATGAQAPRDYRSYLDKEYMHPCQVLGLAADKVSDPEQIRRRFAELFKAKHGKPGASTELQIICSAFLLLLPGAASNAPSGSTPHVQTQRTAWLRCLQTFEKRAVQAEAHCKLLQENLQQSVTSFEQLKHQHEDVLHALQCRASYAEDACLKLQHSAKLSEAALEETKAQLGNMSTALCSMQLRARCAPPYFDALLDFLRSMCAEGEDQRVSSAVLHAAFVSYLKGAGVDAPSQRDLRALLEQLGFQYGQVYVDGGNARGFRGLSLIHGAQKLASQP